MSTMTKINHQKVSKNMSYTIKQLSEIWGIDTKTIRRWIDIGLRIVPGGKNPILISGSDLKEFLRNKDSKKKVELKRSEFYCMGCKAARRAKKGSIKQLKNKKTGLCCVCNSKMCRIFKPHQKDYQGSLFPT